jgi:chorismate mutase
MCARELAVQGATERCIRVMAHVDSDLPRSMVRHVYQYGAAGLRGDLPQ